MNKIAKVTGLRPRPRQGEFTAPAGLPAARALNKIAKVTGLRPRPRQGEFTAPAGLPAARALILRMNAFFTRLNLYPKKGRF